MIYWIGARWHPQFNVFALRCDCGASWEAWAKYSQVKCPGCGARAWLHESEVVWDTTVPLAVKQLTAV